MWTGFYVMKLFPCYNLCQQTPEKPWLSLYTWLLRLTKNINKKRTYLWSNLERNITNSCYCISVGCPKLDFNLLCLNCKNNSNCNRLCGLFELYRKIGDAASEEIIAGNILKAIQPIIKFTHNADTSCQHTMPRLLVSHLPRKEMFSKVKSTYYT